MKRILLAVVTGLVLFSSCEKDDSKEKVFKGPVQQFHAGKVWTWYEVNDSNQPVRLAVAVDDAAMNSLPTTGEGHQHENMASLKFHQKALDGTPFNHVGFGWNPNGHEPATIYDKPHFDLHFNMITEAYRDAIPPYEVDSVKFKNSPGVAYFPTNYFNPGGGVPQMGAHWLDMTSPELSGQLFTQTFIFGSFDGKVIFYEPMITLAFIKANPTWERAIPQPARVQKTGYYPTKLRIQKADGVTNFILDGFVLRQAS
jgi:hypothetical protein